MTRPPTKPNRIEKSLVSAGSFACVPTHASTAVCGSTSRRWGVIGGTGKRASLARLNPGAHLSLNRPQKYDGEFTKDFRPTSLKVTMS